MLIACGTVAGTIIEIVTDAPEDGRSYAVIDIGDNLRHWRYFGEIEHAGAVSPPPPASAVS